MKVSKDLFSNTPKPVQQLAQLAQQEARERRRREFKKSQQDRAWDRDKAP